MVVRTCLLLLLCVKIYGQSTETIEWSSSLDTVWITSQKIKTDLAKSVRSTALLEIAPNEAPNSLLSFNDYVEEVPGLFILNGYNFAQDSRISIRGFGSRSAFGIRGVKLIVDGIPETTPDGQGQLDNLNLSSIRRIEVLKGSAASMYGNASGGVINISTITEELEKPVTLNFQSGSFGLRRYSFMGSATFGKAKVISNLEHLNYDGYRQHNEVKSTNVNLKYIQPFQNGLLNVIVNKTSSPIANDPGGITLESVEENPRQARDRNILFNSGESIDHSKYAVSYRHQLRENSSVNSYLFYSRRQFEGFLPFENGGIINLDRHYWGGGLNSAIKWVDKRLVVDFIYGFDWAFQSDERVRNDNVQGIIGPEALNQIEKFGNYALFSQAKFDLQGWNVDVGIRYDINDLEVQDKRLIDGDDSGDLSLNSFNYHFGANKSLRKNLSVYANYSTSFETPTLSELSSNPSGQGGFNNLSPQKAQSLEMGIRMGIVSQSYIDLTWFVISSSDELIPYELDQFPGRDFYRNAGKTQRDGVEASVQYKVSESVTFNSSYSLGSFKYDEFVVNGENFEGNDLPGIPDQRFTLSGRYVNKSFAARLQYLATGEIYLNNSNSVVSEAYNLLNIYASYNLNRSNYSIVPYVGINNLLNTDYYANVRINAFGARYYEPGPNRAIFVGLKVSF